MDSNENIFDARCCEARATFMTDGLGSIQRETGVGRDFHMPF